MYCIISKMEGSSGVPLPVILVANKCDKAANREVKTLDGRALAQLHYCQYIESSANLRADAGRVFTDAVLEARRQTYFRFKATC